MKPMQSVSLAEDQGAAAEAGKGLLCTVFKSVSFIVVRKSPLKVLVIEDDTLTRVMLCKMLRSQKFTTIEASNGVEGFKLFMAENPDIILTDILMPEKEGLETIMEIRALNPDIPIIAMSGCNYAHDVDFLKMARKLGATRAIHKPIRPGDISTLMSSLGYCFTSEVISGSSL